MILIDTQKEEFNKLKHVRIFSKVENENRFNGNLLVIGLGGVGGKVVTALKRMMMGSITREDNINYLLLDSDIPAMEATIKDSKEGYGLNALEVLSIYRPNLGDIMTRGFNSMPVQESLAKWMSPDFPRVTIGTSGAEGNRQIGRLMFSNAYEDIRILLFEKLEELYNRSEGGKLDIIIVSSTCGGTGSGILADVTYNIKAYLTDLAGNKAEVGAYNFIIDKADPDILVSNVSGTTKGANPQQPIEYSGHFGEHETKYDGYYRGNGVKVTFKVFDNLLPKDEPYGIIVYDKIGNAEPIPIDVTITPGETYGEYTIETPALADYGKHDVYVTVTDQSTRSKTSKHVKFVYDNVKPDLKILFDDNEVTENSRRFKEKVKVSYDYTDNYPDTDDVTMTYTYTPAGGTAQDKGPFENFESKTFPASG